MDTTFWGKSGWTFLFSIAANYPEENPSNELKNHYKTLFNNLQYTLPCKYCRESYAKFTTEIPINLNSRKDLMFWLYQIKDKVNKKLMLQEYSNFNTAVSLLENEVLSEMAYRNKVFKLKKHYFKTKQSPPFDEVYKYYLNYQATCRDTCKIKD